jgi:multiple sugar transport system permease protein
VVVIDDAVETAAETRVDRARRQRRPRNPVTWVRGGGLSTLIFLLPLIGLFALFSWWPVIKSLVLSFQQTNFVGPAEWVGWSNFERAFADPLLGTAAWNTTWFTILAIVIGYPVPIIVAVFVAELRKARGFAAGLAYIPTIIPPVVSVLLWKTFYDPGENGVFNTIVGWFGLGPFPWLQDGDWAMPSMVLQSCWAGFGTATIIYLASLMSIQSDLYEAAEVDGASIWRRVWHVTLPQMRGIMLILLLLQLIGTFQVFTEPFIMTNGGPENRTVTILMLIYRYAFLAGDYGKATALSLVLALALCLLSGIYMWLTRKWSTT